jgi:putative flippase GtrA
LELLRLSRFAVVGILATSTHVGVVWLLIGHLAVRPLLANLLAFLVAFGVSFIGQYRWTFRSTRDWRSALWRFLVTALLGFAMNNILLVALLEAGLVSQELSAVLAVGVIPLVTYTLSRLWVFR